VGVGVQFLGALAELSESTPSSCKHPLLKNVEVSSKETFNESLGLNVTQTIMIAKSDGSELRDTTSNG